MALLQAYLEMEREPTMVSTHGLNMMLKDSKKYLSESHWLTAKLHDIAADYVHQVGINPRSVIEHRSHQLAFWDHHLPRPSVQRAWKYETLADLLTHQDEYAKVLSSFVKMHSDHNISQALELYCKALTELRIALGGPDHHHCEEVLTKMNQALQGEPCGDLPV